MKKILSLLSLAALTIGLLGSCSKINERLDNLEKKVSGIENEQIASINSQIDGIKTSIADLGTIRSDISSLKQSASDHSVDIFNLEEADRALKDRIVNLEDYVDAVLPNYAEKEWVEATFSTLEQYEATCDTIAKIDAKLGTTSEKLSKDIQACADSLTKWVNKTFEGYYTAAQMDAKLTQMKAAVDSAKASGGITDAKADSIASELTNAKAAVDTAKANIRKEYRAAIDTAIKASEGKLTKALTDAISEVNGKIESLVTRVDNLATEVDKLTGRVKALEEMIQSVVIVPAYSDGSVKIANDSLYIDCIVSPSKAVANLVADNVAVLVNKVKTKANTGVDTIKIIEGNVFEGDADKGVISVRVFIKNKIPAADSTITVAVKIQNGISDFTTEFVPVYVAGPVLPAGALPGVFSVSADKKVHFSKGNLWYGKVGYAQTATFNFEANQYSSASSWDASHVSHFTWSSTVEAAVGNNNSGDYLFCDESHKVSVDGGEAIYYALSKDEWTYLFSNHSYKWASVNEVNGYVIAPDGFSGTLADTYANDAALAANNLVFLPAAGSRNGSNVSNVGDDGLYWSSTADDEYNAYFVFFYSDFVYPVYSDYRNYGFSVRLVTEGDSPAPSVVPVTGVTLDKTELSLKVGKSETLVATVQPENATNKNVIWSSDNTGVATVGSTDGKVTAVAEGTATITATTVDGTKTATCTVTVTAEIKTIADVLATAGDNAPSAANHWNDTKGNYIYVDGGNLLVHISAFGGDAPVNLDNTVTPNGDNYLYSEGVLSFTFNMTEGVLTSIYVDASAYGVNDTFSPAPNSALPGVFSVSATKKVHFSKGNLWADGDNALHFEANQYSYASSWNASHVSHFTWSSTVAAAVGNNNSGDYLFCDESNKVSVDGGEAIYYALSKDEWTYLFNNHSKKWATVNGVNGYVIAPDGFTGELASSYADDAALASAGNLVFLPAAGYRDGSDVSGVGGGGLYWSSTASDEGRAYYVSFFSLGVFPDLDFRSRGFSVRLITESK